MRFLLVASIVAVALVLASKAKRRSEEKDEEDDALFDEFENGSKKSYMSKSLYNEPSAVTLPEKHEGDLDEFNRPEYDSDNKPQLDVGNDLMKQKV